MTVIATSNDLQNARRALSDAVGFVASGERGVRARLEAQRSNIDRQQPLQRMSALLDEWAKWSRCGGGLGLGCTRGAADSQQAAVYCISDDEAIAIERSVATLKGEGLSQGVKSRERAEQARVVIYHHIDDISLNMLDVWLRCSRSTVQRRYWDGVLFIHERFSQIMKKNV